MRVLLAHNSYRSDSPSGEQRVVDDELALLREAGVSVVEYFRGSDEIAWMSRRQRAGLVVRPIWSPADARSVRGLIERTRPDVVHLHNVFPLISPYVVRVADALGVPVVQTVHNYRHVCPNGSFFREGRVCTDCAGKPIAWPAVVHGCYRGSRPQSAVMATTLRVHHTTWRRVTRFLPVTEFMAEHLRTFGIPPDRIRVKPNSAPDPGPPGPPGRSLLFAGRLTPEKGLRVLLRAWESSRHPAFDRLFIVGDGPLRDEVRAAAGRREDVSFLGPVSPAEVGRLMASSAAVLVPSLWFEGFPVTVAEAFSRGRAVIATDLGSLSSVVDPEVGWSFTGQDGLTEVLESAGRTDVVRRGENARRRYLRQYSPDAVLGTLLQVYEDVAAERPGVRASAERGE